MNLPVFLVLILLFNSACAAAGIVFKVDISKIEINGNIPDNIKVNIFDGSELRTIEPSSGRFWAMHGISSGYYGAIFFTQKDFYPETVIFRIGDKPVDINVVPFKKLEDPRKGILIGVVYKPVIGGKLRRYKGIFKTFKDENINFVKDSTYYTARTDGNGVFVILLERGEYTVTINNKIIDKVVVEPGKTTIKNIQKGLVLID
ncbi:MAG: hypothetical protein HY754_07130 [Nitrospirae bacterium]|nr:hypothetical protein [Nitrospirota bacterium]